MLLYVERNERLLDSLEFGKKLVSGDMFVSLGDFR